MDSSNIVPHTEDTSDSSSANDPGSPTLTASTESLPSLEDVGSTVEQEPGPSSTVASTSGYCHSSTLIEASASHSSESMDELPILIPKFIGGAVSEDSKYRYTCEDRSSDSDSSPNTNQAMFSDLCDAIKPHIKKIYIVTEDYIRDLHSLALKM